MTFDTWISMILGALADEAKPERGAGRKGGRKIERANFNPVELREIRPEHEQALASSGDMRRVVQPAPAAPTYAPSAPPQPAQQRPAAKKTPAAQRQPLTHKTANGAVRFARTSDAEIARRKAEAQRLEEERIAAEAERIALEAAAALARAEKALRSPSWVRYTRTPDSLRATPGPQRPETAFMAAAPTSPAEDAPMASIPPDLAEPRAMTSAVAQAMVRAAQEPAPACAPLSLRPRAWPREQRLEILIPRSPSMARTDVFLGDAGQRVTIEEFDSPDLRRAPREMRAHPQQNPSVRSETQRLEELLRDSAVDARTTAEAARMREMRAGEVANANPAPATDTTTTEQKRMRVRVKASSQPAAPVLAESPPSDSSTERRPEIVRTRQTRAAQAVGSFDFPPIDLLREHPISNFTDTAPEYLEEHARLLEGVLDDFGVKGEIVKVHPGPVVTLYELEPAPGVKSSRVIGLADDIARSMSAISARVAVVQGRNAIGVELPNHDRETVYLRELLASADFEGSKHRLAIALGKTIGGEPVIVDLARMPHLLVAGTTGSGKSVAINTMILSLLYRLKPEQCRLIMVDPKMLELSVYDGIPHLLTPVVTDPKKAVVALKWAVREMEDRYKKMSKVGVRNIDGFNARVAEAAAKGETISRTVQTGFDRETGEAIYEQEEMELSALPYIVVVVDEMADLMMVAGKDIEGAIQRLAQMARAAGIHLIMATQRPSVDVITGTIKANFPTRISFQVTSKIDSRTILGEQGAEQLLGQGDMLYMAGGGRISRVHGPFVSDAEVEKVVAHLKQQGTPDYLDAITVDEDEEAGEDGAAAGDYGSDEGADLYDRAVNIVLRDRKCSVSYIQRRLSVGYNKAASLVERMEREGVVGQANHSGKREILVGGGIDRGKFDLRDDD